MVSSYIARELFTWNMFSKVLKLSQQWGGQLKMVNCKVCVPSKYLGKIRPKDCFFWPLVTKNLFLFKSKTFKQLWGIYDLGIKYKFSKLPLTRKALDGFDQLLSFALSTPIVVDKSLLHRSFWRKKLVNPNNWTRGRWARSMNAIHWAMCSPFTQIVYIQSGWS